MPLKQRKPLDLPYHVVGVELLKRHQAEGHILQHFHHYAAEPKHEYRAELRVGADTENDLGALWHHLLYCDSKEVRGRYLQCLECVYHLPARGQIQPDTTHVGLV